jgi:phosphinothricin acetyltransferase
MIRDAGARDAEAIAAIWNPVIRDTTATFNAAEKSAAEVAAMVAARQAAGHAFLVAEAAGAVLGFATCTQFRAGVGYARTMEHTVMLAPAAQGRGLGRALVGAVEDHARAGGAGSIFAGVSGENEAGRAFHLRLGYAEVARLPRVGWKFGRWFDLVLLQKFL